METEKLHNEAVVREIQLRTHKERIIEIRSLHAALMLLIDELQLFLLDIENDMLNASISDEERYVKQYVLEDGLALLGITHVDI